MPPGQPAKELLRNFGFVVPGELAGSAHPRFTTRDDVHLAQVMKELGLGALVSLIERPLDGATLAANGIEYLHLDIRDFHAPTLEQIEQFVAFATRNVAAGRPVLAHCHAGMGRTGTMLSCYLVSKGADPRRAIIDVRKRRPGSIETYGQEDAIYAYFQTLARSKPGVGEPGRAAGADAPAVPEE